MSKIVFFVVVVLLVGSRINVRVRVSVRVWVRARVKVRGVRGLGLQIGLGSEIWFG